MRVLMSKNAKAIASLAWKAGMSAVQAKFLQTSIGGISEQRALVRPITAATRSPRRTWSGRSALCRELTGRIGRAHTDSALIKI